MKIKLFIIILFFSVLSYSQQKSYVDSVQHSIKNLQIEEKLNSIIKIPYDKFIGDLNTSEELVNDAISIATKLNDKEKLAEAYLLLSHIYTYQNKREKKIIFYLKSIKTFEELGIFDRAGYAYAELGYQLKNEDLEKGLFYMRKGMETIKKSTKNFRHDAIYDNYGILQLLIKQYDSAFFYHSKSLAIKKANSDSVGIPFGYVHLATVNIQLKQFEKAKKYIDSSHFIRTLRNDLYGITDNYVYYGDLYFAQKNYSKALKYFKKGYQNSVKYNYRSLQKYCANYITKCYLEFDDFENAFKYNNIHQSLKDSVLNAQTNSKVAELQIEFETEKKENEIALQKEQLLKNELQLKNRNLFLILLASGIIILGIIIYGLYKRNQHKKREYTQHLALKEAQTYSKLQDQRLRISRDLHDNIGSQLTFIISSIDNLKFLTKSSDDILKTKLSDINSFATNAISQLRDTIWAMNKPEITFHNFLSRIMSFVEKAKSVKKDMNFNIENKVKSDIKFTSVKGINVFRVIQEAINNAIKYANASRIDLILNESTNSLTIQIKDNGKGFNINEIDLGNGIENMQKRIAEIDGEFQLNSEIGKGTVITITCKKY